MKKIIFLVTFLILVSCNKTEDKIKGRWYSISQVESGKKIYEQNCQVCHMPGGTGSKNWKEKLADGSYPPPPLNGDAHAWHHPIPDMLDMINNGGASYGGKMPPFKDKLNNDEKTSVIAYIHSLWSDKTYKQWEDIVYKRGKPTLK